MVSKPMSSPEAPIPEIALPIISITDDFARAQINDPNSKMARPVRKVF